MSLANDANLLLIPSGYKAGKVYSQFPPSGDGDFTFSRNSIATRVNQAGVIETVGINVPRLDYPGGKCPDLLLEPQRTNNILNSESLSNASWIKYNSGLGSAPIITDNIAISPSGEMNASRLQMSLGGGTTTSDRVFVRQSLTSRTNYYFSVYLKSANGSEQKLSWHYGSDDFLITVTDEWQRFELTRSGAATSWAGLSLRGNLVSTLGIDNSVDILVYGFQAEQGNYPSSYIPTSGSLVTRIAEVCNGAGNSNVFNDSEGVLYVELNLFELSSSFNRYISIDDGNNASLNNTISIQYRTNGSLRCYFGGLATSNLLFLGDGSLDFTENHKIAIRYKSGEMAVYLNGISQSLYGSFVYTSLLGLSRLSFGMNNASTYNFQGKIKDLRYYNTALTDTELQQLTAL